MRPRPLACLMLAAALAGAPRTRAGESAAAETLFREGKELLKKERVAEACDKLSRSLELDRAVGTLALLAYCHERQGKIASAWQEYLDAAALARDAGQAKREQAAREQAATLEKQLPTLRIDVTDPVAGLVVVRGDREVSKAEWGVAVPIDPGTIHVEARAPGHASWSGDASVDGPGAHASITVPALEAESAAAPAPTPTAAPKPEPPRAPPPASGHSPTLGYVLLGVGAVGIGVGSVFGLSALSKNSDSEAHCVDNACDADGVALRDDALSAATISTVGFVVGVAGAGVGTWLILSSGGGAEKGEVGIAPVIAPGLGGAAIRGRF